MRSSEVLRRVGFGAVRALALLAAACHGSRPARGPHVGAFTLEIGRAGGSLRGVASDDHRTYAAVTRTVTPAAPATPAVPAITAITTIEARDGSHLAWHADLDGHGGPLAVAGSLVLAAVSGTGHVATQPVRGEPSAAIVALDAQTGAPRWARPLEASGWSVIGGIAAAPDGVIVAGSFTGSLRAGSHVVTSAGRSDGFIAKLTATGDVAWLVRFGGTNADAVTGVATQGPRIAIAGTYGATAELQGTPLPAFDEKTPFTDGFVAELDAGGHRSWLSTFGGPQNDSVEGVAIDGGGRVVIAATARDTVHIGGTDLVAQGPADGLVAAWGQDATFLHASLLGGPETDGLTGITAVGDHVVVAGVYTATLRLGDQQLAAGGGDDAFLASVDANGAVLGSWLVHGEGREEITALAPAPGGFIAGLAHTASVTVDGDALPAPSEPLAGAALVVR